MICACSILSIMIRSRALFSGTLNIVTDCRLKRSAKSDHTK
jgi:hypothetical protein